MALLSAATACVHGQGGGAEPAQPLLWTAERGGKTTYLFGTVHIGVDADTELSPTVWRAFEHANCFAMEADQDAIDQRALMAMATLPKGQSLRAMVKPEVWKKLEGALDARLSNGLLDRMQPWFVTVLYMQQQEPAGQPMDGVFETRAKAAAKHVLYLESWQDALKAFAAVTGASDLEDLVEHSDEADKQTAELVAAYRSGNERTVEKVVNEINAETPNAEAKLKVLLADRNQSWMPRLTAAANAGGCFVAVGAAHLVGPGNLRERLAAQGYHIERVHVSGKEVE